MPLWYFEKSQMCRNSGQAIINLFSVDNDDLIKTFRCSQNFYLSKFTSDLPSTCSRRMQLFRTIRSEIQLIFVSQLCSDHIKTLQVTDFP